MVLRLVPVCTLAHWERDVRNELTGFACSASEHLHRYTQEYSLSAKLANLNYRKFHAPPKNVIFWGGVKLENNTKHAKIELRFHIWGSENLTPPYVKTQFQLSIARHLKDGGPCIMCEAPFANPTR